MSNGQIPNYIEPLNQISMPELVASRQRSESSFINYEAFLERGFSSGNQITPPELQRKRVSQDFFFVEKIIIRRVQFF
jgi:hypothetical protein